jgi:hypothetical protein
MPLADTGHWFAAVSISVLFWWTVASPVIVLALAVLTARRPRLQYTLTILVVVPPLLELLPLAAMRGGLGGAVAGLAAAVEVAAVVLAAAALMTRRAAPGDAADPAPGPTTRSARLGWAAAFCAVAGGMIGSLAFLNLFS